MNQLLAIRSFVRVAEAGSFSKAAHRLGMPRSTASKLISDLEQHLGVRLLQRSTRSVALTAEGKDYLATVADLLLELDEADARVRGQGLRPKGRLRVDVTSSFANFFLIERLPDFRSRYPELVLELGVSDRTIDVVGEGVDCAVRVGELRDSTLLSRRLFTARTALCASPGYLARKGHPAVPSALLEGHDLIGYFVAATSRPLPIVVGEGVAREEIASFALMANESTAHIGMMLAGLGIGQNIYAAMSPLLRAGTLVEVLPDYVQPPMPYHLIYPPNRTASARLRAFTDWLVGQTTSL